MSVERQPDVAETIVCVGAIVMDLTNMQEPFLSEFVYFPDPETDYVYPRHCYKCRVVDFGDMKDPLSVTLADPLVAHLGSCHHMICRGCLRAAYLASIDSAGLAPVNHYIICPVCDAPDAHNWLAPAWAMTAKAVIAMEQRRLVEGAQDFEE